MLSNAPEPIDCLPPLAPWDRQPDAPKLDGRIYGQLRSLKVASLIDLRAIAWMLGVDLQHADGEYTYGADALFRKAC